MAFLRSDHGDLKAKVFRSGAWVAAASVAQNLLQTGRSIVLARLLSPEAFGLMGICMIVIRGLDLFTETGFGAALIHRQEQVEEAKNTAFTLQVLRGVALTVLALAVAPLAADFYDEPRLTGLIWMLAMAFTLSGFANINTVLLEKKLDFRLVTMVELSVVTVSTIVVIGLAYVLRSVWAIAIGHVAMVGARLVLSYVLVPGRPTFRFDRQIASELFRYGRFITGLTIALFLTTESDNLVVGKLLGLEWLGFYTVAYMLANLPATHFSKVASRVLFPAYASIQTDYVRLRQGYLTVMRIVGSVAIPAAVGLGVLAPDLIRIVYGERWLPAAPALRILVVFGACRAIGSLGGYVLQAVGKPDINFYMVAGKLVVILAVLPWATRHYGIEGAALAVTIPQFVVDLLSVAVVKRIIGLDVPAAVWVIGRPVVASALMGVAVWGVRQRWDSIGPVGLVTLVLAGIGIYATLSLKEIQSAYVDHLRPALALRKA